MERIILLLVLTSLVAFTSQKCGYESCPVGKPDEINVHLVAHTHDDVGWLKTVDQYYYGARNDIQRAGVQYILDSVVDELDKHPDRKFTYVETAFFWRWWSEQSEQRRARVRQLVDQGRLQFAGGGWSMNDEACAHYTAIIDQMTLGLRWLRKELGGCAVPKVAWQIDPFGHSKEQASLFAQMGFDGLFFGRLDYADMERRVNRTELEMIWLASEDLGADSELFSGALFNHYSPPPGHCYDTLCSDSPIIDGPAAAVRDSNVPDKINSFLAFARRQSQAYQSNHILMTMGEDFNYQNANMWFKNLDKLIKYVNGYKQNGKRVNVFYSTPACYLKALNRADLKWPTKSDDFLPYASDSSSYWTGFYTSRPTQKYNIRQSSSYLQACKQITAVAQCGRTAVANCSSGQQLQQLPEEAGNGNYSSSSCSGGHSHASRDLQPLVQPLRRAVAVNQHHDAVTGTEKQHVFSDYTRRLYEGVKSCQKAISLSISAAVGRDLSPHFCTYLNMSQCDFIANRTQFTVSVYNTLAHTRSDWLRLPVAWGQYRVLSNGETVACQLVPVARAVLKLPGRQSSTRHEVVFLAKDLPPLGFKSFQVIREARAGSATCAQSRVKTVAASSVSCPSSSPVLKSARLRMAVACGRSSAMHGVVVAPRHSLHPTVSSEFGWYKGYGWNNARASGAYVFHPEGTARPVGVQTSVVVEGPLVSELQLDYDGGWMAQTMRLYHSEQYLDVDWVVGPIPNADTVAREIVVRYNSTVASGDTFYTDANGRQMIKRRRNHRDTWPLNVTEPVASNYYPVTERVELRDRASRVTVLTDRSQGAASLSTGQLELMLHRRTVRDDDFGVGEPLNETEFGRGLTVRGNHWLLLLQSHRSTSDTAAADTAADTSADDADTAADADNADADENVSCRSHSLRLNNPLLLIFHEYNPSEQQQQQQQQQQGNPFLQFPSIVADILPPSLHVLTLEAVECDVTSGPAVDSKMAAPCAGNQYQILLRLEHIYSKHEHGQLGSAASVDIQQLLPAFHFIDIVEMSLGADRSIADARNRLRWRHSGPHSQPHTCRPPVTQGSTGPAAADPSPFYVTLCAKQIRTFLLNFARH